MSTCYWCTACTVRAVIVADKCRMYRRSWVHCAVPQRQLHGKAAGRRACVSETPPPPPRLPLASGRPTVCNIFPFGSLGCQVRGYAYHTVCTGIRPSMAQLHHNSSTDRLPHRCVCESEASPPPRLPRAYDRLTFCNQFTCDNLGCRLRRFA